MALGDLVILAQNSEMGRGGRLYNVAAGTLILAGEPVQLMKVGDVTVVPSLTGTPVVGTSGIEGLFVGVATTNSTNTSAAAGSVYVMPVNNGITYLIAPADSTAWDTQTEYDALVGKRVLIQNSTTVSATAQNVGTYSLLASDSAANGAVVQALDIAKYPGKVAIAFRGRTSNLA